MVFEPRDAQISVRRDPHDAVLPDGITSERNGDTLRIAWPFENAAEMLMILVVLVTPFALAAYFVPVWYALALAAVVGFAFTYLFFASLLGKRVLVIDGDVLMLFVRPLPTRRRVRVKLDEIGDVDTRRTPHRGKVHPAKDQLFLRIRGGGEVMLFDETTVPHDFREKLTALRDAINVCRRRAR